MSFILKIFSQLDPLPKELTGIVVDYLSTKNFVVCELIRATQNNELKLFQVLHKKFTFAFEKKENIDILKSIATRNGAEEVFYLLDTIYHSFEIYDHIQPQFHVKSKDAYLTNMIMKCEEKKQNAMDILNRLIQLRLTNAFMICFPPFCQLFKFTNQEIYDLAKRVDSHGLIEILLFFISNHQKCIVELEKGKGHNIFTCMSTKDLYYFLIAELRGIDIVQGNEYELEPLFINYETGVTGGILWTNPIVCERDQQNGTWQIISSNLGAIINSVRSVF